MYKHYIAHQLCLFDYILCLVLSSNKTGFKITVRFGFKPSYDSKKIFYGYYVIQSSKQQKFIEEKRLSTCDAMTFIEHFCILDNKKP